MNHPIKQRISKLLYYTGTDESPYLKKELINHSVFKDIKFCKLESFNTNILHQLFDYTIPFVYSQH